MEVIEYTEEYGPVCYPEDFEANLEGLSIEEQLKYFRLGNRLYLKKPFFERRKNRYDAAYHLDETKEVKALASKDGKIAGVKVWSSMKGDYVICKPECSYCCRYDEELDGSGYQTHALYLALVCVSEQFETEE